MFVSYSWCLTERIYLSDRQDLETVMSSGDHKSSRVMTYIVAVCTTRISQVWTVNRRFRR